MATKKVVINTCFGGFGLSPYAVQRLAELQGRQCYFFVNKQRPGRGVDFDKYERVTVNEAADAFMFFAFDVPEYPKSLSGKAWTSATQEERIAANEEWRKREIESRDVPRHDPHLIQVVEELGEKANGKHAALRVVEIPGDVDYSIEEYDGSEHIAEQHRTWR